MDEDADAGLKSSLSQHHLWQVCRYCWGEFPQLLSYPRFVALIPTVLMPMCIYLNTRCCEDTGRAFVDATSLVVCHNAASLTPW